MKTRNLLLIGALVFIGSLILDAPVALLNARFAPPDTGRGLHPAALDGSLADGHAAALLFDGKPILGNLHWHLTPVSLLLMRIGFNIESTGDLTVNGHAARLLTGGLNIDDLRAAGPIRNLLVLTGDENQPIDGGFGLKLDSARIRGGFLSSLTGELTITALKLKLLPNAPSLGDFVAHITTDKGVITAKLEPLSGGIDLNGEIRLKSDRTYEVDLRAKPKPDADPAIANSFKLANQAPDAEGFYRIRTSGTVPGG